MVGGGMGLCIASQLLYVQSRWSTDLTLRRDSVPTTLGELRWSHGPHSWEAHPLEVEEDCMELDA